MTVTLLLLHAGFFVLQLFVSVTIEKVGQAAPAEVCDTRPFGIMYSAASGTASSSTAVLNANHVLAMM